MRSGYDRLTRGREEGEEKQMLRNDRERINDDDEEEKM